MSKRANHKNTGRKNTGGKAASQPANLSAHASGGRSKAAPTRALLITVIVLVGATIAAIAFGNSGASALPAGVVQIPEQGGVQRIEIAAQNSFSPGELAAKTGVPIELAFGPGSGCAQAVKLPTLGIEQAISGVGAVVKLADVKPGKYDIFCQSNMDMGTLYVQ